LKAKIDIGSLLRDNKKQLTPSAASDNWLVYIFLYIIP
jgi:hypothetical protein